jgi:hypothetical protein
LSLIGAKGLTNSDQTLRGRKEGRKEAREGGKEGGRRKTEMKIILEIE